MKGLFVAVLFSIFSIGTGHNSFAQNDQLAAMVDIMQSMTPMPMGMVGEMTDISISRGELVLTATVDESLINIKKLQKNPELLKENLQQLILDKSSGIHYLIDELKKSDLGLRLIYIGQTSGETVSCALTNKEVKQADYNDNDPDKMLELQINLTNAQLPMDFGNGMVNTKLVREGNYVVYYYVCEEPTYDIDRMQCNVSSMRGMILNEVNGSDPTFSMFRKICKDAGCGIAYYYVGNKSGKVAKVLIPASDLK